MPRIVREAEINWEGTTARGSGVVRAASTGSFELSATIASRIEVVHGKTSPEELLAAAHATCFVTSLGSELARMSTPPERMHVRCTITMDEVEGHHRIVHSAISARGVAPGADAASFAQAAADADAGCPFSALIRASATVTVDATLEEGTYMADSTAHVTWTGSLMEGSGTIDRVGSGAFEALPVSWKARTGETGGQTTPEELIAAAHASCFSMALSNGLAQAGTPSEKLDVDATVTFVPGTGITKSALTVRAVVPGIDEPAFLHAAQTAVENCPVSQALASVPEITVEASLA